MTFVHDISQGESGLSEFWLMDAKTMSSNPIAVVNLPVRVPFGFHGLYLTEEQVKSQL